LRTIDNVLRALRTPGATGGRPGGLSCSEVRLILGVAQGRPPEALRYRRSCLLSTQSGHSHQSANFEQFFYSLNRLQFPARELRSFPLAIVACPPEASALEHSDIGYKLSGVGKEPARGVPRRE